MADKLKKERKKTFVDFLHNIGLYRTPEEMQQLKLQKENINLFENGRKKRTKKLWMLEEQEISFFEFEKIVEQRKL